MGKTGGRIQQRFLILEAVHQDSVSQNEGSHFMIFLLLYICPKNCHTRHYRTPVSLDYVGLITYHSDSIFMRAGFTPTRHTFGSSNRIAIHKLQLPGTDCHLGSQIFCYLIQKPLLSFRASFRTSSEAPFLVVGTGRTLPFSHVHWAMRSRNRYMCS